MDRVIRLLLLLLGTVTAGGPRPPATGWYREGEPDIDQGPAPAYPGPDGVPYQPVPVPPWHPSAAGRAGPGRWPGGPGRPRRRRIPLGIKWAAAVVVAGLIFRKAIAAVVLMALSAAFHLVGVNVHLPSVKLAWPWQTVGHR